MNLPEKMESLISLAKERGKELQYDGCSRDEINEILSTNNTFLPPESYLSFMRKMGKKAGHIFLGSSLFYPGCLLAFEDIDEIFSEEELEKIFLFGHHQGYQYYFFKKGEAGVWMRTDLTSISDERVAASFEELLEKEIEAARKILCPPPSQGC
ncbi:hypothetical protein [Nocardiopsis potens]|uniref:hypothetical protein n=1 Tax=Nocardiopsis potens TaxID=1246458 RepID=UPI001267BD77|nr:hypothetical protein [Nocardiopsis potens]